MSNRLVFVLKSGYEIVCYSNDDVWGAKRSVSTEPGSVITCGDNVIVCSEIAAILTPDTEEAAN